MDDAAQSLAYCGVPPVPADLAVRWNLDPVLLAALLGLLAACHFTIASSRDRAAFAGGWLALVVAFVSPLCALSVALFSARVGQHMLLVLVAAPLLAASGTERIFAAAFKGLPGAARIGSAFSSIVVATALLAATMWIWHAPGPYDATLRGTLLYWLMHLSLLGAAWMFWRAVLDRSASPLAVVGATVATAAQMSLLGALITFAAGPLYAAHAETSWAWGLPPLQDQQLGGLIMWVPGGAVFLALALYAIWRALPAESPRP